RSCGMTNIPGACGRAASGRVLAKGDDTTAPDWERERAAWREKAEWAERAGAAADELRTQGLERLAGRGRAEPGAIAVVNPSSYPRDDVVRVPWPATGGEPVVLDPGDRAALPAQIDSGELVFLARKVPPLGYRTFPLGRKSPRAPSAPTPGLELETSHYRV